MNLRKIFFWAHLVAGLTAGLVIALLALTGLALSFEPQIVDFMERDVRRIPAAKADVTPTSIEDMIKFIREYEPDARPTGFTIYSDPRSAVVFPAGRGMTFYVDPNTEHINEAGNAKLREFFNFTLSLHRYLALSGPQRQIGDKIVGVATCVFLALSVTGLIIWWPRRWNWRSMKPSVVFIKARGKLRDWNWHNVIGLWTTPLLIIICVTGLMMSYRWVGNLAFVLTGNPPPPQRAQGGPAGGEGGAGEGREGAGRQNAPATASAPAASSPAIAANAAPATAQAQPEGGMGGGERGGGDGLPAVVVPTPPRGTRPLAYGPLLAKVRETYPNWTQLTVRMGGGNQRQRRPGGGAPGAATPAAATSATPATTTAPAATTASASTAAENPANPAATPPAASSAPAAVTPTTATAATAEPAREGRPAGGGERGERGAGGGGGGARTPQAVSVTVRTSDMWFSTSSLTLSLDPYTGDILRTQGFADQNLGRRLRALAKPVHMGLIAGWPTQLLAAIAALGALFLVYTGFALSWRRFFGKNGRNKKAKNKPFPKPVS